MVETKELKPPPLCLALVLADAIWRDPSTGKRTILGAFSELASTQFPATHGLLAVHCALTDGYGANTIKIRLVKIGETDDLILEGQSEVQFDDPRMVAELDFHLANVQFPTPGEYRFQIFSQEDLLMERRFVVRQVPSGDIRDE